MTPQEFRALLEKATARPWGWRDSSQLKRVVPNEDPLSDYYASNAVLSTLGSTPIWAKQEDRDAIVATMNRAELFAELWAEATKLFVDHEDDLGDFGTTTEVDALAAHRIASVVRKLEAAP